MKYFMLAEETKNPLPQIGYWFGTLSPKSNTEKFGGAPTWVILNAAIKDITLYSDVLTYPCILLTEKVLQVFQMYHGKFPSKPVILLDKKNQIDFLYHLAKLPIYSVLREESKFDRLKSEVIHGVLDKEKISGMPIFLIGEVTKPTLIIREDVAESLIRRSVKGIKLKGIDIM